LIGDPATTWVKDEQKLVKDLVEISVRTLSKAGLNGFNMSSKGAKALVTAFMAYKTQNPTQLKKEE